MTDVADKLSEAMSEEVSERAIDIAYFSCMMESTGSFHHINKDLLFANEVGS